MNTVLLSTILSLCLIGVIAAVILYAVARKFHVDEDPLIDKIEQALPGVNCGACGLPGCRAFAETCVKADSLDQFFCTPGGNEVMQEVARLLGKEIAQKEPMIAVVRCNGTPEFRPKTSIYDGAGTCAIASYTYTGDTGCAYGCLGMGDCITVCPFDAIRMDTASGLPVVDESRCTACGKCVSACPKHIITLQKKGLKGRRVYVCCINQDKGGPALKACKAACIGCGKCLTACPFEAIILENNLAHVDAEKCRLCRKCASVCPTGAIHEVNFPARVARNSNTESGQDEKNQDIPTGRNTSGR